jgi:tetratricopeptide (TPR) repeat protein
MRQRRRSDPRVGPILLILLLLVLSSCGPDDPRLESMVNLEPEPPSSDRVEELRALVDQYDAVLADAVKAASGKADALKLLAQEYMRHQLYGPALEALDEAIRIQPQNRVLHYLAGAAAGFVGKSQARADIRRAYLDRAERSYRLAIEAAPDYIDARYGLAVLYVFELSEPVRALTHLEHVLGISEGHVPSLFVLARAHVALGNVDDAIDAYERIIQVAQDNESRQRAERNRQLLLGGSS